MYINAVCPLGLILAFRHSTETCGVVPILQYEYDCIDINIIYSGIK